MKLARQKRSGAGSLRLKGAQIKTKKSGGKGGQSTRALRKSSKPIKSKTIKPRKS